MVMVLDMTKGSFNDASTYEERDGQRETLAMTPALALQEYDFATATPQQPEMPVELIDADIEVFLTLNESC